MTEARVTATATVTSATAASATSPAKETSAEATSAAEATSRPRTEPRVTRFVTSQRVLLRELLTPSHLPLDDLSHEPDHAGVPRDPQLPAVIRGLTLLQVPLRHELVKLGTADQDIAGRVRGWIFCDPRAAPSHAPDRN